ncbi:glutathione S-transferase P 10-like [Mytilus trossulus]|uniref:glutathione S-transferase P 10-like n=1 Tax=Mytilus trossulus TaxID=6551 RepID=UPI003006547A
MNEADLIILFQADYGKILTSEVLPKYFAFMSKLLKENGGEHLVGSKLSLADVAFFDMLDKITGSKVMGADLYKDFADIKTFYENVQKLPKIKSYLEKRLPSDL